MTPGCPSVDAPSPTGSALSRLQLPRLRVRHGLAGLALALLAGCGAAPGSGPSAGRLEESAAFAYQGKFPIVELTDQKLAILGDHSGSSLAALGSRPFDGSILRPGDQIKVTVFDTGEDGLISSPSSKTLELGTFRVDRQGYVSLPYAGRMKVSGGTAAAAQEKIAGALRGSSVSPQATVLVTEQGGSGFTVNGQVKSAGRFGLSEQSERVLDAIAMAGGPDGPPGEMTVTLIRGTSRATVPMDRLLADQAENVYVRPNDQIFVRREAPSFISFGAFGRPGEYTFETDQLTLAQAIARSGGLLDDRANPHRVYLFRYETTDTARALGAIPQTDQRTGFVPVIYSVDMTQTPTFFILQSFRMRNRDVLYVPNSGLAEFGKLFQIYEKVPAPPAAPLPSGS